MIHLKKHDYLERASYCWSEDSIRHIATPSNTAKKTYFYIQEIGYFQTKAPYFTERQNLDSFLVIYTVSGHGKLFYGDTEYDVKKGQCFYLHCQEYHHYWTPDHTDWEFVWIHFNGPNALGYYQQFVQNGFKILNTTNGNIEHWIRSALECNLKKNVMTEILTSNMIHNLLTELLIQNCTNDTGSIQIPAYIKSIAKKIDCCFREPLCLDDFACEFHRSKYYICKEFKKYMGVSLNEYIITSRISYAKELLRYSDLPVSEIAYETGMNNVTHFINLFKARENVTPLVYRTKWKD